MVKRGRRYELTEAGVAAKFTTKKQRENRIRAIEKIVAKEQRVWEIHLADYTLEKDLLHAIDEPGQNVHE